MASDEPGGGEAPVAKSDHSGGPDALTSATFAKAVVLQVTIARTRAALGNIGPSNVLAFSGDREREQKRPTCSAAATAG